MTTLTVTDVLSRSIICSCVSVTAATLQISTNRLPCLSPACQAKPYSSTCKTTKKKKSLQTSQLCTARNLHRRVFEEEIWCGRWSSDGTSATVPSRRTWKPSCPSPFLLRVISTVSHPTVNDWWEEHEQNRTRHKLKKIDLKYYYICVCEFK